MLVPWSGSEVVWKEEGRRSQQNTLAGALHRLNASATTLRFISLPPRGVLRRAKLVWLRLTAVKAAALRVNLNINGCSIVAPPARPSRSSCACLTDSLLSHICPCHTYIIAWWSDSSTQARLVASPSSPPPPAHSFSCCLLFFPETIYTPRTGSTCECVWEYVCLLLKDL